MERVRSSAALSHAARAPLATVKKDKTSQFYCDLVSRLPRDLFFSSMNHESFHNKSLFQKFTQSFLARSPRGRVEVVVVVVVEEEEEEERSC